MEENYIKNSYRALKDKNYKIFKCIYRPDNKEVRIFGENFVKANKYKCKIIYKNKEFKLKEWLEEIDENYNKKELIKLKLKIVKNNIDTSYLFKGCNKLLSVSGVVKGNNKKILIEASDTYLSEYRNKHNKLQIHNNKIENNILYKDKNELLLSKSSLLIIKVNNAKNIDKIFFNNSNEFKEIKGINKINTNKESNIPRILINYNKINISKNINIINMTNMFNGCNILKEVNGINLFNTIKVNDMSSMFQGCRGIRILRSI